MPTLLDLTRLERRILTRLSMKPSTVFLPPAATAGTALSPFAASSALGNGRIVGLETADGSAFLISDPAFGPLMLSGARQFAKGMPVSRRLSMPAGSSLYVMETADNLNKLLGDLAPEPKVIEERVKKAKKNAARTGIEFPKCPECGSDELMPVGDFLQCRCGGKVPKPNTVPVEDAEPPSSELPEGKDPE